MSRPTLVQFVKVVVSGGLASLFYYVLLNILRFGVGLSSFWSVTLAFAVATGFNYVLNRHWSFGLKARGSHIETGAFYLVSIGAWALTVGIVQISEVLFGPLGPIGLNVTNLAADAVILVPKFFAFRSVVFRKAIRESGGYETR